MLRPRAKDIYARVVHDFRGNRLSSMSRELFFRISRHFVQSVDFSQDELMYRVPTNDRAVALRLFSSGPAEYSTMETVIHLLTEINPSSTHDDARFLEIGANLGTASVAALHSFGFRSVTCFEPLPSNFSFLTDNLALNGLLANATLVPKAVSSENGFTEFEVPGVNSGDGRLRVESGDRGYFGEDDRDVIKVETITLDSYFASGSETLDDVGLVWIDAQGSEAKILAGASGLLNSKIPVVVELWPYGLRRAGDESLFIELIGNHFTQIIDLADPDSPKTYEAGSIGDLVASYGKESFFDPRGAHSSTDLLLLTD